jgi:predicted porin
MILRAGLTAAWLLLGFTVPASAGDAWIKDPVPDNLTWQGITLYGTVDLNYTYQTHGVPVSQHFFPGLEYTISGSKNANRAISSISESGIEQSKIGLKAEEPLWDGWKAIGKAEAGFQPLSLELADACASMVENNGKPLVAQNANSDGSRCGQPFSGPAYAGVSNVAFGTLTFGRHSSLGLDAIADYDPQGLPYAFSLIGYSGGTASAFGNTETGRWNDSVKYVYNYGPAHAAALYSPGGEETAMFGGGYSFNAGAAYKGFSIDGVYAKVKAAVSSTPITYGTSQTAGYCNATGAGGGNICPSGNYLDGTVTDGEGWEVMGKYTYDFGAIEGPSDKLSLYAGYVHTQLTDPHQSIDPGAATIGGYQYYYLNMMPYASGSSRVLQTMWTGAKYQFASGLSFTGAFYRYLQDEYISNKGTCAKVTSKNMTTNGYVGVRTGANCAGALNETSFVIDYPLDKHFDVYTGAAYSEAGGGLSSGYLNTSMATFTSGIRLRF